MCAHACLFCVGVRLEVKVIFHLQNIFFGDVIKSFFGCKNLHVLLFAFRI